MPDLVTDHALAGLTIAVTAARRRLELGALLERQGARVLYAPAIRIGPLPDEQDTLHATQQVLAAPVDVTVLNTAIGLRGWLEGAESWGLADELVAHLGRSRILARGAKVRGALRAAGLHEDPTVRADSTAQLAEHLTQVRGLRVAVQLDGEYIDSTAGMPLLTQLHERGAQVLPVPVYRWHEPVQDDDLSVLLQNLLAQQLAAITFTSAPAAGTFLRYAEQQVGRQATVTALRAILVACVGAVTAAPLTALDVPVQLPAQPRLGALARLVAQQLPSRLPQLAVAGHLLQVRGHAAVLDQQVCTLAPGPMAVLRTLARQPGAVCSRAELSRAIGGGSDDEHAVEMTVARLRTALGVPEVVETVTKRGYRLACHPLG